MQTYRRPSPADAGNHGGAWLLPFPVWLQLGVRAALRSFLVDLFVPKIKLRERERVAVAIAVALAVAVAVAMAVAVAIEFLDFLHLSENICGFFSVHKKDNFVFPSPRHY